MGTTCQDHLGPSGTIWDSQVLVINCHQPRPGVSSPLAPSPAAGHIGKALVLIPPQHARPSHQSSWGMEHWCILKNNIKRQSKHIKSYKHDANNKLWYWLTMGPYGSLWYGILWYMMAASCSSCIMTNSGGLLEFQPAWPWGFQTHQTAEASLESSWRDLTFRLPRQKTSEDIPFCSHARSPRGTCCT